MPAKPRVIAVDWSGRGGADQRNAILLAEVAAGRLVRLESGRTRDEVVDHLLALADRDLELIVGFDFAFSLPAWFFARWGLSSAGELWAALASESLTPRMADVGLRAWLQAPEFPFWRTSAGHQRLRPEQRFRQTEAEARAAGWPAKSVFQLVGAGQVGAGSLYGMQALHRLAAADFGIWPFNDARPPSAVEIYPRLFTGGVVKSSGKARAHYVRDRGLGRELGKLVAASEHAFDAVVSAFAMAASLEKLRTLRADTGRALEGAIWAPSSRAQRSVTIECDGREPERPVREAGRAVDGGAVEVGGQSVEIEGRIRVNPDVQEGRRGPQW